MIYQVLITDFSKRIVNLEMRRYDYGHKISYYEFTEDGYIQYAPEDIQEIGGKYHYKGNNANIHKNLFYEWNNVDVVIEEVGDKTYTQLDFSFESTSYHFPKILIKKSDVESIQQFYRNRNKERQNEAQKMPLYLNESILNMAENLLNMTQNDIMLNCRIASVCYGRFSHLVQISDYEKYKPSKYLQFDTKGIKGKKKTELEKYSAILQQQYRDFIEVLDNFVDLVKEELKVKQYVAKAVAWQAIQIKAMEHYGQIWQNDYDSQLEITFNEMYEQMDDMSSTVNIYMSDVIHSAEIDPESTKEILMYFLLWKNISTYDFNLPQAFEIFYRKFRSVKNSLKADDIKSKLKTKQVRKVNNYSIDDVDLMTGEEFEEFVGVLFRKMGYSTQITKHSGDQGLDVIASKNGLKIGVQAKCYSSTVGNSAVQEAVAGKKFYNCNKVIVITNNYFTSAAMELAQVNGVVLWSRDMLKEKIKELM